MSWRDRIAIDSDVLVGKPVVKGTRIAVEMVVDSSGAESRPNRCSDSRMIATPRTARPTSPTRPRSRSPRRCTHSPLSGRVDAPQRATNGERRRAASAARLEARGGRQCAGRRGALVPRGCAGDRQAELVREGVLLHLKVLVDRGLETKSNSPLSSGYAGTSAERGSAALGTSRARERARAITWSRTRQRAATGSGGIGGPQRAERARTARAPGIYCPRRLRMRTWTRRMAMR